MDSNANEKEYLEIDPLQLLKALWHRAWIVVLSAILVGAIMFWYASFLIAPKYTASAMLYVNNSALSVGDTSIIGLSELTAAQSLVNTYVVILNSRNVLNDVIEETGVPYDYTTLKSMIAASPVESTEVFSIDVTSENPQEAEQIANCICRVLPDKLADVVDGSSMRVVDYAVVPSEKSSPNVTRQTAIGMMIGVLVSTIIILIVELCDQYIRSEEYLLQTFENIPVLAVIPDLEEDPSKSHGRYYYSNNKEG